MNIALSGKTDKALDKLNYSPGPRDIMIVLLALVLLLIAMVARS
jgi:hypothetical protein